MQIRINYDEIARILREIRGKETQADFANKVGSNQGYVSRVERAEINPSIKYLVGVASYKKIPVDLILFGDWQGEARVLRFAEDRVPYGMSAPELKVVSRRELDDLERWEAFVSIPLVRDEAAAGPPRAVADDEIEGFCLVYESWAKRPEDYICVRVKGDSMEPILPDGSIVAINLKNRAPGRLKGKIVAARHGGGVTVKELRRSESGEDWLLVPYNKEHSPIVIKAEEDNPIIGKVAWWWAKQE